MQHIFDFLSFSRVISTDKISAQLSMYLDFSGRYLYCKDSLIIKLLLPLLTTVISHDLVNLPIFCYDYKLCLSTIISFKK